MRACFDKTLYKRLDTCGLDINRYNGQSFRIGAATYAAKKGLSDAQIRSMGRWNSNAFQKTIRSITCICLVPYITVNIV